MKQTFRFNTFETNSSTTHAMVIFGSEEENNLWNDGKLYVDWDGNIHTEEEVNAEFEAAKEEFIKRSYYGSDKEDEADIFQEWLSDSGFYNCDTWWENLEQDCTTYTTKSGDTIYIHCAYGYDA